MCKKLLLTIGLIILVIATMGLPFACSSPSATITPTTPPASSPPTPSSTPTPAPTPTLTPTPALPPAPGMLTIPQVVAMAEPSVVAINVEVTTYDLFNQPVKEEGAGSGWIISSDGYIVTNNHVVENADNVTITLSDGRIFKAGSIKTDPLTDLAVVKINATNLPALKVGDSSKLLVGDGVVAIGNALGQGISATAGIISAVNVSLAASNGETLLGLIQTDAAINPGNSGGPLVNMQGEVIGIDSIKVAEVGVEGMGYAISINQASPIINALIQNGYITRPWLGVGITTVNDFVAALYNLSVNKGVLITSIVRGSPADKAGLQQGDVITAVNGQEIDDTGGLLNVISTSQAGQTVEITYQRGNSQAKVSVTLAESPPPQY
jgi:serine protease Do